MDSRPHIYNADPDMPQAWYWCMYFEKDAGMREPFEYPDEGGWVIAQGGDGSLESAMRAMDLYGQHHRVKLVYHTKEVVEAREPLLPE